MIIGGVELVSLRSHGGVWLPGARLSITATRPSPLPPNTLPGPTTNDVHRSMPRHSEDLAVRITLGLWALYIPNLVISTGLRVMAWGSGTAGGSAPGESQYEHRLDRIGTPGHDESGYWIGAGHPDY